MNGFEKRERSDGPVRIAHVVGKMLGGGLEATVMNYYRRIDRSVVQYDFIVDDDSSLIPEEIEQLGGRVILVPPYQRQMEYQKKLYQVFKENQYPIVISHMNTLSVFPLFAAWRAKVPIRIAHNHSTAGKGEWKKNLLKYSLRPFAKVFPTHLCACTKFAGEWLFGKKAVNAGKVTVWQNSVEIGRFGYDEDRREAVRKALGIEDRFVIGHAGRFIHQKNHEFIVDVFEKVHQRNENAVLLLIGNGELAPMIKEKVKRLGLENSVLFLGIRSDIADLYQAMDVFVMPSFYEGLGMVAVEAQIAGMPVLCADTIPTEAKICDNMKYLSLNDSAETWADEALKYENGFERVSMVSAAADAGYDIQTAAPKMTGWYKQLLKIDE